MVYLTHLSMYTRIESRLVPNSFECMDISTSFICWTKWGYFWNPDQVITKYVSESNFANLVAYLAALLPCLAIGKGRSLSILSLRAVTGVTACDRPENCLLPRDHTAKLPMTLLQKSTMTVWLFRRCMVSHAHTTPTSAVYGVTILTTATLSSVCVIQEGIHQGVVESQ